MMDRNVIGSWIGLAVAAVSSVLIVGFDRSAARPAVRVGIGYDSGLGGELRPGGTVVGNLEGAIRIRDVPSGSSRLSGRANARRHLAAHRSAGNRTVVLFLSHSEPSRSGKRKAGLGGSLPLDLREAFDRARAKAVSYGRVVDYWEVDNEPDLVYVPENPEHYAAYLKATYWGLRSGARRVGASEGSSRVLMAPMALPPGPYYSALMENGLLSYTDGFNYHYYGYAEDFTGVYRQFERAVSELQGEDFLWDHFGLLETNRTRSPQPGEVVHDPKPKSLPVFLTEYGYGLLSGAAASTVEGRLRQWRYFRDVSAQARELRIEAPMAFYLPPYLENEAYEFGLTIRKDLVPRDIPLSRDHRINGSWFIPQDFDVSASAPWMQKIATEWGSGVASPALAWLASQPGIEQSRSWDVMVQEPSPIVIDLVAGPTMVASKSYRGYWLRQPRGGARADGTASATAELRVYNFGTRSVTGRLVNGDPMNTAAKLRWGNSPLLTIGVGQMLKVPVEVSVPADRFVAHPLKVVFVPETSRVQESVFATNLYPDPASMSVVPRRNFGEADGRENRAAIANRPLATGEPKLIPHRRWLLSKGVSVEERDGVWRFTVTEFPDEPMRPAMAELILPDDFRLEAQNMFSIEGRLVSRSIDDVERVAEPRSEPRFSSLEREPVGFFWRTRNGNLYMTFTLEDVRREWRTFFQMAGNIGMGFYGRAELPWRFLDNKPAALVFHFRPRFLPAVYEFRNASIADYQAAGSDK